jgi:glycosyltransferase involved in cell wall biosynthesis
MTFQRKRILYINHTGNVSGAERVLVSMLRSLDRAEYEPFVSCPAEGDLQRLVEQESIQCLTIPSIHARFTLRPGRLLRYAWSLCRALAAIRKTIREIEPDIVHANTLRAGIAATLASTGASQTVIWHVHDILPRHPISTAIRFLAYVSERTRIIAVSNAAARRFSGAFSFKNRVRTIYNGTDLKRFPLKRRGVSPFRKEAGIPEEAFLVCSVGQICARKGLRELLDAFSRIHTRSPQMHFAVIGSVVFRHEEKYREGLELAADASGIAARVHFTGERRDVPAVLQAADLLVLNSAEEPFGLVLIEAMSSGTPVLATRVGGIPEIVRDSENGWLVERGDTAGLASKLLELSQNRDMLAQAAQVGHDVTCQKFSLERFQSNLHRCYADIDVKTSLPLNAAGQASLAEYSNKEGV